MNFKLETLYILLFLIALSFPAYAARENSQPALRTTANTPAWAKYKEPYVGDYNNLAKPNRTNYEISNWAQKTVAEVLSFDPEKLERHLKKIKKYFVKKGWIKYARFLDKSKTINLVTDDGYSVRSIVNLPPDIINKGSEDKIYHWIVKMPITISIFKHDENNEIKTRASENYILYMDLIRVKNRGFDNSANIAISDWEIESSTN